MPSADAWERAASKARVAVAYFTMGISELDFEALEKGGTMLGMEFKAGVSAEDGKEGLPDLQQARAPRPPTLPPPR